VRPREETVVNEPVFTLAEIAKQLNISDETSRRMFADVPDVLVIGKPGSKKPAYRVPMSVRDRVIAAYKRVPGTGGRQRKGAK
jgi:hypothetical protein